MRKCCYVNNNTLVSYGVLSEPTSRLLDTGRRNLQLEAYISLATCIPERSSLQFVLLSLPTCTPERRPATAFPPIRPVVPSQSCYCSTKLLSGHFISHAVCMFPGPIHSIVPFPKPHLPNDLRARILAKFYISLCESGSPIVNSDIRLSTGTDTPLSLSKKLDITSDNVGGSTSTKPSAICLRIERT